MICLNYCHFVCPEKQPLKVKLPLRWFGNIAGGYALAVANRRSNK
jgi:hypothetical protein